MKRALESADASPPPPANLAAELEYPDPSGAVDTRARTRGGYRPATAVTERIVPAETLTALKARIEALRAMCTDPRGISIGDAVNLAILEEMLRDPTHGASRIFCRVRRLDNIPANTQQAFGTLRAADEIIDEGHFMGSMAGEAMNGYRPIVELMNAPTGIYGDMELSSAGNTYAHHRRSIQDADDGHRCGWYRPEPIFWAPSTPSRSTPTSWASPV